MPGPLEGVRIIEVCERTSCPLSVNRPGFAGGSIS